MRNLYARITRPTPCKVDNRIILQNVSNRHRQWRKHLRRFTAPRQGSIPSPTEAGDTLQDHGWICAVLGMHIGVNGGAAWEVVARRGRSALQRSAPAFERWNVCLPRVGCIDPAASAHRMPEIAVINIFVHRLWISEASLARGRLVAGAMPLSLGGAGRARAAGASLWLGVRAAAGPGLGASQVAGLRRPGDRGREAVALGNLTHRRVVRCAALRHSRDLAETVTAPHPPQAGRSHFHLDAFGAPPPRRAPPGRTVRAGRLFPPTTTVRPLGRCGWPVRGSSRTATASGRAPDPLRQAPIRPGVHRRGRTLRIWRRWRICRPTTCWPTRKLVTYAAAMAGRPAAQWTLDERAHLHRLGETARKAAEELSRAHQDWDEWCRRSLS